MTHPWCMIPHSALLFFIQLIPNRIKGEQRLATASPPFALGVVCANPYTNIHLLWNFNLPSPRIINPNTTT